MSKITNDGMAQDAL